MYNDVALGFAIDRTIIIRVNACCVALSPERMQQISPLAVSKIRDKAFYVQRIPVMRGSLAIRSTIKIFSM
jgi:hypothetical protein